MKTLQILHDASAGKGKRKIHSHVRVQCESVLSYQFYEARLAVSTIRGPVVITDAFRATWACLILAASPTLDASSRSLAYIDVFLLIGGVSPSGSLNGEPSTGLTGDWLSLNGSLILEAALDGVTVLLRGDLYEGGAVAPDADLFRAVAAVAAVAPTAPPAMIVAMFGG